MVIKIKDVFTFAGNSLKDMKEDSAAKVLLPFLQRWNYCYMLQVKLLNMHKYAKNIVRRVEGKYAIVYNRR